MGVAPENLAGLGIADPALVRPAALGQCAQVRGDVGAAVVGTTIRLSSVANFCKDSMSSTASMVTNKPVRAGASFGSFNFIFLLRVISLYSAAGRRELKLADRVSVLPVVRANAEFSADLFDAHRKDFKKLLVVSSLQFFLIVHVAENADDIED
jgi:hypothetical protein